MARRTFFSFHYQPDVSRAQVVRNSWVTQDRQDAGFFDASVFEAKKREGVEILKRFLREALNGSTVTCVLAGTQTAARRWVRYEVVQSFRRGNGILCVFVDGIKNLQQLPALRGANPLDQLAFRINREQLTFLELNNGVWEEYGDAPGMNVTDVAYDLKEMTNHTFSNLFHAYDWNADDGYTNLAAWIETAARNAGK